MCSIISLSGAASCRQQNDFYCHKSPLFLLKFGCSNLSPSLWFKLAHTMEALLRVRALSGESFHWKALANLMDHLLSWSWLSFKRHCYPVWYLKLHSVCGFKPSPAPLTHQIPRRVLGVPLTGLRLHISRHIPPHTADLWRHTGSKETSHSDLAAESPPPAFTSTPPPPLGMWHSTWLRVHYL